MSQRKEIVFAGWNESTTYVIKNHLERFLGKYVTVRTWCLRKNNTIPSDCINGNIYVASCYSALKYIKKFIPNHNIIVADRALNMERIDELLELTPGLRALVVGNSQETAELTIELIKKIGIDYLQLVPYYSKNKKNTGDINVAITTGSTHLVPQHIKKIIDLGVKVLDLSTYVDLITFLNLPKELINNISGYYLKEIFELSLRRQKVASLNRNLKRRLEVIIDSVEEAIIAVDNQEKIILANTLAKELLNLKETEIMGKKLNEIIPEINLGNIMNKKIPIKHEVKKIKNIYYVFSINPILDGEENPEGLVITINKANKFQKIETKLRRELKRKGNIARHTFKDIIGKSDEIKRVLALAEQFAETELTVLIEGESGTGKELFAQAIHNASQRKNGPFVAINFAALPDNLAESELFGYEEGAFTGAKKGGKMGLFENAHNGTIFLDEIGDTSLKIQTKLLRVLEEKEVRRVGGSTLTPINVRVIAATNQNLNKLVSEGKFRSDLFYRLCTLPLRLPALRERKNDILLLFQYFSSRFYNRNLELDPNLKVFLKNYMWPGNIRELENVVKYLCSVLPKGSIAQVKDLPVYMTREPISNVNKITHKKKTSDFDIIYKELIKTRSFEEVMFILKEMEYSTILNKGLGRYSLSKRLYEYNMKCSDYQIKTYLNWLEKMGFVKSGKTKQGTRITNLGRQFLNYITQLN